MKRLRFVALLLLCAVGPLWADPPPGPSLPARTAPAPTAPHTEGSGFTSRPRLVGPLSGSAAVDVALAQSLRIGISREETLMATAERLMAASELGLKVSATAVGAAQDRGMIYPTAPGVMPAFYAQLADRNAADFNLMAMLPLLTGGRLQALLYGAQATEKAALARQAWELLDVAREARIAYARVLLARQKLEVAGWEVEQQGENLSLVEKEYAVGRVARYQMLRASAELANARQRENDRRAELEIEQANLKATLGVDMASSFEYVDALGLPAAAGAVDNDMRQALSARADLIAARLDVTAAGQAVRAARARYAPQVFAVGMLEQMYETGRSRPSAWNGGYSAGVVASIPVLDAGERRAQVMRGEADQRRRGLQAQALELEVTRQVIEARTNLDAARRNVALAEEEVARAEEDLRVARLRFLAGRAIHLEVIDALATLARARLNRINALYQATVARADLLRATGRLKEAP